VPMGDLQDALSPSRFTGRAAAQVDEFLDEVVDPLLAGTLSGVAHDMAEVRV
jgi:hypothetical protein